jgi:hypothetical protein
MKMTNASVFVVYRNGVATEWFMSRSFAYITRRRLEDSEPGQSFKVKQVVVDVLVRPPQGESS